MSILPAEMAYDERKTYDGKIHRVRGVRLRGFELLDNGYEPPERGTSRSAGYDLTAAEDAYILPGETAVVKTGITAYMQDDEYLLIKARSGNAIKDALIVGAGVIDADYYGKDIGVVIHNFGSRPIEVERGDRIAQGLFQKYLLADHDIVRQGKRTGGFGSTGRR